VTSNDNLDAPVTKRLTSASSEDQRLNDYNARSNAAHAIGRSLFQHHALEEQIVPAQQRATHPGLAHQHTPAGGADINAQERISDIEREFAKIREAQERDRVEFELACQIQNERMEELERVLNSRSRSQPKVSIAPSGHERGTISDDAAVTRSVDSSTLSKVDLDRDSMNEDDSNRRQDNGYIKDEDGSDDGGNIYDE
jgi:hypothetical protein